VEYRKTIEGAIPIAFCDRQKKWLPMEEHMTCEHCVAEVFDECGEPVSFICTHSQERKEFQPDWVDHAEIGRGTTGEKSETEPE